eukprot:SAG25_NODE_118_length_14760_cov_873.663666_8_plen_88_part_00
MGLWRALEEKLRRSPVSTCSRANPRGPVALGVRVAASTATSCCLSRLCEVSCAATLPSPAPGEAADRGPVRHSHPQYRLQQDPGGHT